MSGRIKVLNVNYDSTLYGGVSVFLMNVFRHSDHEKFQIDFLTANTSPFLPFENEIKQAGGEIYELHVESSSAFGKLKFGRKLRVFLKTRPYDIIHINSGAVSFNCISAIVAKSCGTKVIVHSHNTSVRSFWKSLGVYLMKLLLQKAADVLCACSKEAAMNMFTSAKVKKGKVIIIKNGIDLQKFQFNKGTRDQVRQEMNLKGRLVIGHVGRFSMQKNHEFLIDIFTRILCKEPTAVLLLIGDGELEPIIREKVQKLQIQNDVIFLGNRDDIENLYQAMDVLLFPSLFEGLPLTLIEAQATGLQCCISDTITTEVDVTSLIHRVSLQDSAQKWADEVLSVVTNNDDRSLYAQKIGEAGYEIEKTAEQISSIYERLMQ